MTVQRKTILLIFVVILVVVNVWRWWPSSSTNDKASVTRQTGVEQTRGEKTYYRVEDFQVRMLVHTDSNKKGKRNLFRPKIKKRVKKRIKKRKGPPPKTKEQLAEEAARAELASIKCVGIAFRGGKGQAFMSIGGQTKLVSEGGKIGQRFIVERISTNAVDVRDPRTGVTGHIALSGR